MERFRGNYLTLFVARKYPQIRRVHFSRSPETLLSLELSKVQQYQCGWINLQPTRKSRNRNIAIDFPLKGSEAEEIKGKKKEEAEASLSRRCSRNVLNYTILQPCNVAFTVSIVLDKFAGPHRSLCVLSNTRTSHFRGIEQSSKIFPVRFPRL